MSESPPSPETTRDAAHSARAQRGRRVLKAARELVCRCPITSIATLLFLLGGLASFIVREVLPRFGVRAPVWVEAVIVATGLVALLVLYLITWPNFPAWKPSAMSEHPPSPDSTLDAAHSARARRRHRILAEAREFVGLWPITCFAAMAFLLGGLASITAYEVLPRFGVRAPVWLEAVIFATGLVSLLALHLITWPFSGDKKKA